MQTNITTFLWFEANAAAAAEHYCSIFADAKITSTNPTSTAFEINGQRYIAFNGGPHHKLSPSVSLLVTVTTQAEIDALWDKFIGAGGTASSCGWLIDKFGLSWQIIPRQLMELCGDPDRTKGARAVQAMLQMQKIDLAALQRAHAG